MNNSENLKIKLFADGADIKGIREMAANPRIQGFTTNPTLMRQADVTDYEGFARDALEVIGDKPISFEVFSDDFEEMEKQALVISSWGKNVYVKIPVTNTKGEFAGPLIKRLSEKGVQLNVTALMTLEQVKEVAENLSDDTAAVISVFAGRIANTGRDPEPIMKAAAEHLKSKPKVELLWASPREFLNLLQADRTGCHIITATNDILKLLSNIGKDLDDYSRETVQMFYDDAKAAGYTIKV